MRITVWGLFWGQILILWLSLNAAVAGPGPLYALNDLCREAAKNAEQIQMAQENVTIAEDEKNRALSVLTPRISTFGSVVNHKHDSQSYPDSTTLGINLTQSFTINGKELTAYNYTKKGIEKSEFALERVKADYLFSVAESYFQTLSAKRKKEIAVADMDRLKTHRDSVKEKLSVGSVTKTDLYRAEAELSKARTSLVTSEHGIQQGKARIARLAGIDHEFSISAEHAGTLKNFHPTLDGIKAAALENRNEIKEARKDLERAMDNVKYEKGDYWPVLSLEAGYKDSDISYDAGSQDNDLNVYDPYIQAQLVFTLYDGGLRSAQISQARARERQASQNLESVKNDIVLQAKVAFLEYETARNTLINLQDELKSANENYNAVKMQFKYGMADSIDMMDANTLLVTAERSISDAQYALVLASLKIKYIKSELTEYLLN